MSHRGLTSVLSLVAVALIGSAIASPASASAGHYNVSDPIYSDPGTVVADAGEAPTWFTEPSGFHTNIRWDSACRYPQHSPDTQRDRPTHAKVEPIQEPKPSRLVAKCKWTNVHCSGM